MKRFRLATLLLVVVIAALCLALVAQAIRATRREAELQAMRARYEVEIARLTTERDRFMRQLQVGPTPADRP